MQRSRACVECGEEHLLQRNGQMSIHQKADGERCTEQTPHRPATNSPRRNPSRADELDQAFEYAARYGGKNRRVRGSDADRLDRRIYATGGVHVVNGGAPGAGKRR